MHATAVKHRASMSTSLPVIRATIVAGENDVGIRISDEGTSAPLLVIHCYMSHIGGGLCTPENPIKTPSDLFSFSHIRNATRMEDERLGALRSVSSSPEGVRATVGEQVGRWQNPLLNQDERNTECSSNDPELDAGVGPHPRIGIGLPMSNIFATCVVKTGSTFNNLVLIVFTRYFGGSLELVSLDGWGTFVVLQS
jgi:hypothetical protein